MHEPSRSNKEQDTESNAAPGQHQSLGIDSEKQDQGETKIAQRREYYPDDDAERVFKEFLAWLKQEKVPLHGWITALSSIALTFVTIGQLVTACNNYRDTSPLVGYAGTQASAAQQMVSASKRNATAAENFSTAAGNINTGVSQAVGKLNLQAQALSDTAKASAEQAADSDSLVRTASNSVQVARDTLELENRPWLYIKTTVTSVRFPTNSDGTIAAIDLKFSIKNVGKSIAKNIHIGVKLIPQSGNMMAGLPFALNAAAIQKQACDREETGDQTFNLVAFPVDDPVEISLGTSIDPNDLAKNEFKVGDKKFVNLNVVGCVSYHSSFSMTPRRTWFSYLVTGPITQVGGGSNLSGF